MKDGLSQSEHEMQEMFERDERVITNLFCACCKREGTSINGFGICDSCQKYQDKILTAFKTYLGANGFPNLAKLVGDDWCRALPELNEDGEEGLTSPQWRRREANLERDSWEGFASPSSALDLVVGRTMAGLVSISSVSSKGFSHLRMGLKTTAWLADELNRILAEEVSESEDPLEERVAALEDSVKKVRL